MKMQRCEMEVFDAIDEMLMADDELMAEIEAEIWAEIEPMQNFKSVADYEDYIIECMTWDYKSDEDASITDILWRYGYEYEIKPSASYNIRIRNDIIINADDVVNIHVLRQFCSNVAIWIDKCEEPARIIYTGKDYRVIINFD